MKKGTTSRRPTAASLKEMPEVHFPTCRIRRNPYAARIEREGVELVHREPSVGALLEMPEADFSRARIRPNRYAIRAAETAAKIQYGRGRPRKGDEIGSTPARTLRLPAAIWEALEREARERSTTVHALLRELVANHVTSLRPAATP